MEAQSTAQIEAQIAEKITAIQPELIKAIQRMTAIYSVEGPATEEAPFGEGPKKALDEVLQMAEELGFETKNIDNKIGYAQYGEDKGQGYLGIFGHIDVVPIGKGWLHDPLAGQIDGNRIYGRGVLDNKGPIISNLYVLYVLKELGIQTPLPIRIVFGTNEETGFGCVKHYITKEPAPIFGWTPDCKWPVVYGERGRARVTITAPEQKVAEFYQFINQYILSSTPDGKKLGINYSDEDFGTMLLRGYQLSLREGQHCFSFSASYPAACTADEIITSVQAKVPEDFDVLLEGNWDPILYDKDSDYVQLCQQVYNEVTGLEATPVTTTGGTFAKIIPNIIAYGPSYPGQKDIAHLPDEWLDLDDLAMNSQIYAKAIYRLINYFEK